MAEANGPFGQSSKLDELHEIMAPPLNILNKDELKKDAFEPTPQEVKFRELLSERAGDFFLPHRLNDMGRDSIINHISQQLKINPERIYISPDWNADMPTIQCYVGSEVKIFILNARIVNHGTTLWNGVISRMKDDSPLKEKYSPLGEFIDNLAPGEDGKYSFPAEEANSIQRRMPQKGELPCLYSALHFCYEPENKKIHDNNTKQFLEAGLFHTGLSTNESYWYSMDSSEVKKISFNDWSHFFDLVINNIDTLGLYIPAEYKRQKHFFDSQDEFYDYAYENISNELTATFFDIAYNLGMKHWEDLYIGFGSECEHTRDRDGNNISSDPKSRQARIEAILLETQALAANEQREKRREEGIEKSTPIDESQMPIKLFDDKGIFLFTRENIPIPKEELEQYACEDPDALAKEEALEKPVSRKYAMDITKSRPLKKSLLLENLDHLAIIDPAKFQGIEDSEEEESSDEDSSDEDDNDEDDNDEDDNDDNGDNENVAVDDAAAVE